MLFMIVIESTGTLQWGKVHNIFVLTLLDRWKCLHDSTCRMVWITITRSLTKTRHLCSSLKSRGTLVAGCPYLQASRLNHRILTYQGDDPSFYLTEIWEDETYKNLSRWRQLLDIVYLKRLTSAHVERVPFWRCWSRTGRCHDVMWRHCIQGPHSCVAIKLHDFYQLLSMTFTWIFHGLISRYLIAI